MKIKVNQNLCVSCHNSVNGTLFQNHFENGLLVGLIHRSCRK